MKKLLFTLQFLLLTIFQTNFIFSQQGISTWTNFPVPIQYTVIKKDAYVDAHDTLFMITSYITGNDAYILSFKNGNWNSISLYGVYPTSICKWNNQLFVGTQNSGFYSLNNNNIFFSSGNTPCMASDHVFKIRGYGTKLYAATAKGLVIWDGNNIQCLNSSNAPLINDSILDFTVKNNKLYLATPDGFYIKSGNNWQSFNSATILNSKHHIDAIEVDDAGNVWATSRQSPTGLLMWNGYTISNLVERFEQSATKFLFKAIDIINIPGKGVFIPGYQELSNNVLSAIYTCPAILINMQDVETFCISQYHVSWENTIYYTHRPNGTLLALNSQNELYFINKFSNNYNGMYEFNINDYNYLNCFTYDNFKYVDINKLIGTVGAFNSAFPHTTNTAYGQKNGLWIKDYSHITNSISLGLWAMKRNGPIAENLTADRFFYNNSPRDTWPGPLKTDGSASIDIAVAKQFNRVWKVSQAEIDNFLFHLNNGNVAAGIYEIPNDILEWPVSGPAGYDTQLAPYVDVNNDGTYNPLDGDYPEIKGKQMLYFVLNDKLDTHQSGGLPLGIEIRVSVYACKNDTATGMNEVINRTIFQEYEIFNRTNEVLDSVVFSFFTDYDIRNFTTNYVGTHVDENATYGIYGSASDEPNMGNYLKICQSMQLLNMPSSYNTTNELHKTMYFNKCNGCLLSDPNDVYDYKNYMEGKFRDDSPLHFGGNGYPGTMNVSSYRAHFAFPGNSDPTHRTTNGVDPGFIWDEISAMNSPDDRRIVASTKPVKLLPHTPVKFTLGLITTYDSVFTTQQLIDQNRLENQVLKSWTLSQSYPCYEPYTASLPTEENKNKLIVYPNPSDGIVHIISNAAPIQQIMVYDLQGKLINHTYYTDYLNSQSLNLAHLHAGTYIVKIIQASGAVAIAKIILY